MKIAPVTDKMMKMRMGNTVDMRAPNNGMRNQGQSELFDALGAEMKRKQARWKIRTGHNMTPRPPSK